MMKKIALLASLSLLSVSLFALPASSAEKANHRTALRCLTLSKGFVAEQNWSSAISQATLGLSYDENISDLWYLIALSKSKQDAPFSELKPLVEKALETDKWVDYNRDGARLMYADILCDTLEFYRVPEILDEKPMIYSADAEYVRTKAYYRMGDIESLSRARSKIDSARKMYPDDKRFPLLFFKYESPESVSPDVQRLVSFFIPQITQYVEASPDKDAEIEIYASLFAKGTQKEHLLKSFAARDLSHPLYARAALEAGLITEQKAFDYIADFAENTINYSILNSFISLLKTPDVIKNAQEFFNAYNGIISADTDGDGIDNLHVKYERGRPQTIFYDENQDGIFDWVIVCDFGLPVAGTLNARKMDVTWDSFPYLKSVVFKNSDHEAVQTFNLVSESLKWAPALIEKNNTISDAIGIDFFFPIITVAGESITNQMLIDSASSFTIPTSERQNATITFSVLNGLVQTARYEADGIQYAFAKAITKL